MFLRRLENTEFTVNYSKMLILMMQKMILKKEKKKKEEKGRRRIKCDNFHYYLNLACGEESLLNFEYTSTLQKIIFLEIFLS